MDPLTMGAFMSGAGGITGGKSAPVMSSSSANAGQGSIHFGGSPKTNSALIFGSLIAVSLLMVVVIRSK